MNTVFEGYNATIIAYGQTGTGKTYTMGTADHVYLKEEEKGIVPRSITDIFSAIEAKKMHMNIAVSVSFIEVYKEDVRDLLDPGEGTVFVKRIFM